MSTQISNKENEELNDTELTIATEVHPAIPPSGLSDKQVKLMKAQADKVVKALVESSGSESLTIADQITNVGIQDQKTVSNSVALLQERMGNVFYSDNKSSVTENISKDILELQSVLAKINPKDIEKENKYRFIRLIPFFGNKIVDILKTSSDRRLTLQEFVNHLEESLKSGETMLRQDNAQLKVMYQDLETKEKLINMDAYLAELLMEKLSTAISEVKDGKKKNNLNKVLFKVATRAQDLRAMENIHEQFYTSIEMTRDNNDMLIATVQRMLSMGMNVVYVAFAIHAALARQSNVLEAQKGTRDFLGNMIVNNATTINSHVKEIGDLYKEPIVAMDKLEKAIGQLEQAIDATNKLKAEGIERAKENIVKIKIMTEELKNKSGQLLIDDIKSLEASETLALPVGKE
jgi:uncharacterized protein YaaN involved in tellurite resistance